jgi:hypothetical protein
MFCAEKATGLARICINFPWGAQLEAFTVTFQVLSQKNGWTDRLCTVHTGSWYLKSAMVKPSTWNRRLFFLLFTFFLHSFGPFFLWIRPFQLTPGLAQPYQVKKPSRGTASVRGFRVKLNETPIEYDSLPRFDPLVRFFFSSSFFLFFFF